MSDNIDLNENSFCISKSPTRYNHLVDCFRKYGIKPPKLYNVLEHHTKVNPSHKKIIETAIDLNLDYVIIFEDDAYPCIDCLKKFNEAIRDYNDKNIQSDVIVLGRNGELTNYVNNSDLVCRQLWKNPKLYDLYEVKNNYVKIDDTFIRYKRNTFGAHAYIVKKSGYKKHIENLDKNICDLILSNYYINSVHCIFPLFLQKDLTKNVCYIPIKEISKKFKEIKLKENISKYIDGYEDNIVDYHQYYSHKTFYNV